MQMQMRSHLKLPNLRSSYSTGIAEHLAAFLGNLICLWATFYNHFNGISSPRVVELMGENCV